MIVQSYLIQYKDLTANQKEILCNIAYGYLDVPDYSFVLKISDIVDCLDATQELNDGKEVCDCQGRHWVPNYDADIEYMTNLIVMADGCEYVIVNI